MRQLGPSRVRSVAFEAVANPVFVGRARRRRLYLRIAAVVCVLACAAFIAALVVGLTASASVHDGMRPVHHPAHNHVASTRADTAEHA